MPTDKEIHKIAEAIAHKWRHSSGKPVEDPELAGERMPHLMKLAAMGWRTWVSYEPALGPVNWERWLMRNDISDDGRAVPSNRVSCLVCGGETGPGARPMHPDWARQARDQCKAAGVPFFLKSLGRWEFGINGIPKRLGREKASRLLDGVEHNELPGKD